MINNLARSVLHKALEGMLTPEKIEETVMVIVRKVNEEKMIENTARSILMTLRASVLEMTSAPDPEAPK